MSRLWFVQAERLIEIFVVGEEERLSFGGLEGRYGYR